MRICAVINCSNSTYQLERWRQAICEKHMIKHEDCSCKEPFKLIPFPTEKKDPEGRKQWIRNINRKDPQGKNWQPTADDRVCSVHFKDLGPTPNNPYPTEHLGYNQFSSSTLKGRPSRKRKYKPEPEVNIDKVLADDSNGDNHTQYPKDHTYAHPSTNRCSGEKANSEAEKNTFTQLHQMNASRNKQKTNAALRFIKTDCKTKKFTGLRNQSALYKLVELAANYSDKMKYWYGTRREKQKSKFQRKYAKKPGVSRKLSILDEVVLVLMKLRTAMSNDLLCELFEISVGTCSCIFNTWLPMLANLLKPLLYWPQKEDVLEQLPESFRKQFFHLRCTIDCTEVHIEKPRDHKLQALSWSDYKKNNTVKFLVAIAPNGSICFLSKAWGGRTSDRHIVRNSGFLEKVEPGDLILADRGFTIREDLLLRHATLEIPPPSKGVEQMTTDNVKKTKLVANARIC